MIKTTIVECGCEVSALKKDKAIYACSVCNKSLCSKHAYQYVDESNIAITRNSKVHCRECYRLKYNR